MTSGVVRVLVTSAGRRVELLACFRRAAYELNLQLELLACDLNAELSAACQSADASFNVPRCNDPNYSKAVLDIARERRVNLVVPTIDPELLPLALASDAFAAIGARVHVSTPDVVSVAQNKVKTAKILNDAGVPTPVTLTLEEARHTPGILDWPAFLKPVAGSASRGISVVKHPTDLPDHPQEPMLVQQMLKGPEYTVNIFIDQTMVVRSAIAHERLQVRAGEVEKGRTVRRDDLLKLARQIASALPGASGVLCFQVIDDVDCGPRVFEINARFGGGYPLVDHAGGKFAKWLLEESMGLQSSVQDSWREGVTMLRYDAAVFQG